RLFEPSAQAPNSGQMARSGAGLGLAICRTLRMMMGGNPSLDSTPGHGTRISMNLVLTTLEALTGQPVVAQPAAVVPQALRILIVDDHPANRLLLCQQLGCLGPHCELGETGAQGLERWQTDTFDLAVADCTMPITTGYDMTAATREPERAGDRPRRPARGR
ncbi:response regulator, partial [Pseudomonas syringae]